MRRPTPGILLGVLIGVHLVVVCAGFFAPYDPTVQHRAFPFAPPTQLRFVDAQGAIHLRPFVYRLAAVDGAMGAYREDSSRRFPVRFFVPGAEYRVLGVVASRRHLFGVDAPASIFVSGTDGYGRDQFSRFLFGGQVSLTAGIMAALLSLSLGLVIGTLAGFSGPRVDETLMRVTEMAMALPWLYLLLAIRAILPLSIQPETALLLIVVITGGLGWPRPSRLIRAVILVGRQRRYVVAARGFGANEFYLLRAHVLPQTIGVLCSQGAVLIPQFILAEVGLSFVGLGIAEPMPTWGNMLAALQQYHVLASAWWMFLPAVAMAALFWVYHALADGLHERFKVVAV